MKIFDIRIDLRRKKDNSIQHRIWLFQWLIKMMNLIIYYNLTLTYKVIKMESMKLFIQSNGTNRENIQVNVLNDPI